MTSLTKYEPLTETNWPLFEALFGDNGACGGCWCQNWKMTRSEFEKTKGDGNKARMLEQLRLGQCPGVILIENSEAIAWCAIEPRTAYPSLERSRVLKPVDDEEVWSISCLFIRKDRRNQGMSKRMIVCALEHAQNNGGSIVEAYPVEPKADKTPDVFAWTGIASAFLSCGFEEVARRSETRPIMRHYLR